MCSFFWQRMESEQGGDLGDIIRASGCGGGSSAPAIASECQLFPPETNTESFPLPEDDAFSGLHDPALFDGLGSVAGLAQTGANGHGDRPLQIAEAHGSSTPLAAQKNLGSSPPDQEITRPCSIFTRVLQISPNAKDSPLMAIRPPPILVGDVMKLSSIDVDGGNQTCHPFDHGCSLQISSPRTPGIKRRKSQAKKVVCIPAPAAAGSRPTGEVVPSDLWAWRKYGQKPIKGSPYPRGYYRCSSSKGCSARKQVERSRTDPNMLVITYTSEHNHPWPTQRNALAGSTRAQPSSKTSSSSAAAKSSPRNNRRLSVAGRQEEHVGSVFPVKEEAMDRAEKPVIDSAAAGEHDLDRVFQQSYKAMFPDSSHSDDFFADLGELEPDPMELVFSKGFMGDKPGEGRDSKSSLDPFSMFDWGGGAFGEPKKGGL